MNFNLKSLATTSALVVVLASSTELMAWGGYSMGNAFGGHNYYNSNGSSAGYSMGNAFGGHNYYNSNGSSAGYSTRNVFGGYNYYRGNSKEIESKLFSDKDIASKIDIDVLQDALIARNVDAITSFAWDLKGVELILGKKDKKTTSDMLFTVAAKIAVEQGNAEALKQIITLAPNCKKFEEQLALKGKARGIVKATIALPQLTTVPTKDYEKAIKSLSDWQEPIMGDYIMPSFRGMTEQGAVSVSYMINSGRMTMNPQMLAMGALELSKYEYDNKLGVKFQADRIFKEAAELAVFKGDKDALTQIAALYGTSKFKENDYSQYLKNQIAMMGTMRGSGEDTAMEEAFVVAIASAIIYLLQR